MVNEKAKHLLAEVYRGRLDGDIGDTAAFSDVYTMKRMSKEHPGKMASPSAAAVPAPFEFVSESNMDFENYKNRPEFSDDHGGEGSLYGGGAERSSIYRPDTPGSHWGGGGLERGRPLSRDSDRTFTPTATAGAGAVVEEAGGVSYPAGYHQTPSALREYSPSPSLDLGPNMRRLDSTESTGTTPYEGVEVEEEGRRRLVGAAAPMGRQGQGQGSGLGQQQYTPYSPSKDGEGGQRDYFAR
jgi:hypothetical protein